MAENKTQENDADVNAFLDKVEPEAKRNDSYKVLQLMEDIIGVKAKMWGPSIIGFGNYRLKYESGREMDWFYTGFSPRRQNLTIYIMNGFGRYDDLLSQLGKHKTGKSCLYISKLEQIDMEILKELISESHKHLKQKYG